MDNARTGNPIRMQSVERLTRRILHCHYCEDDAEAILPVLDDPFSWLGVGEQEYMVGADRAAGLLRQYAGSIPRCEISQEEFSVVCIAPDAYLCSGRFWLQTAPETGMALRVHQRCTAVFRWRDGALRCCHIHLSNPCSDMAEGDVGFPSHLARQSHEYLQKQLELQRKKIAEQQLILERISFQDALTGLYNRHKFTQMMNAERRSDHERLGIAYFDLNGLKETNDRFGHSAGDALICNAANEIRRKFEGKAYRTGGDEFVVIDPDTDEAAFREAVSEVCRSMEANGISHSVGVSWRNSDCSLQEQFDEADQRMYQEKRRFYSQQGHDRRRRS